MTPDMLATGAACGIELPNVAEQPRFELQGTLCIRERLQCLHSDGSVAVSGHNPLHHGTLCTALPTKGAQMGELNARMV
jgi:hypothetical protein